MHINKDGILMSCIYGCLLNLYEIKGKNYKKIERIRPYSILDILIGRFSDRDSINELIELKNGNLVIMVYSYAICFYKKKEKSYSYLNKINQNIDESATDLCEIGNKEYCFCFGFKNIIKFFETNSQKITHTIKLYDFSSSLSNNQILLINKTDLIVAGEKSIIIIDVVKKEIIKNIETYIENCILSSIYKLSDNNILKGCWKNSFEQYKYDEIKKEFIFISKIKETNNGGMFEINTISIFNNKLIVSPLNNQLRGSFSLMIYKLNN